MALQAAVGAATAAALLWLGARFSTPARAWEATGRLARSHRALRVAFGLVVLGLVLTAESNAISSLVGLPADHAIPTGLRAAGGLAVAAGFGAVAYTVGRGGDAGGAEA